MAIAAVEEDTEGSTNKNVETFSSESVNQEQEEEQEEGQDQEQDNENEQEKEEQNGDEDGTVRNEKLKKLGMLCVSLGLQPKRMTDKMMSTIKRSKDIERDQRNVISKLSSVSSIRISKDGNEEEYDEEDDDHDHDHDDDDDDVEGDEVIVVGESSESVAQTNEDKGIDGEATDKESELNTKSGKSLKRKKIPPPLNLSETSRNGSTNCSSGNNSATSTYYARENLGAKSAPANVPKFPRSTTQGKFPFIGKPRVQYLGKVSNVISRQQPNQINGYKLKTPYVPYFPRGPSYPPPPSMPAYPYYPYAYPGQFPVYQTPQQPYGGPPFMVSASATASTNPRSAMPYSSQAQYYQESDLNGKRPKVKRQHQQVKKPKVQETGDYVTDDLRGKEKEEAEDENHKEDGENEQRHKSANDDDCESAHLAIENGAAFSPSMNSNPNTVLGEIRILRNVFSFEFPVNSSSVDKKMFMSICDKVWDESKGLDKGYRLE